MKTFTALEMELMNTELPGVIFQTFEEGQAYLEKIGLEPGEPTTSNGLKKQTWDIPRSMTDDSDEGSYDDDLFRGKLCTGYYSGGPQQPDCVTLIERPFGVAAYDLNID